MTIHLSVGDALFVLGAADPEMHAIEDLLGTLAVPFVRATHRGKRVHPANAYRAALPREARSALARGGVVYLVECVGQLPPGAQRIDHHHPGDPGYGLPPTRYWEASSLGQAVRVLREQLALDVAVTPAMRLIAAADHCLGAAYRGDCPGIAPGALLDWHVASRAAFGHRAEAAVRQDLEHARQALQAAAREPLAPGVDAADLRGQDIPELLLAGAHDGQCFLSAVTARDGRRKIGCLVGNPAQVEAFMRHWAPAHGLVDIYGDPARGFAGAYEPLASGGRTSGSSSASTPSSGRKAQTWYTNTMP